MENYKVCNFRDCGRALSTKDLSRPHTLIHNKTEFVFCEKHYHKVIGMVVEIKRCEDRLNKNITLIN